MLSLISLTSAIDCWGEFEQNTEIVLIQKCPSCSYVNITSITYPDGTTFLNDEMVQTGINFNYSLPDSSQIGIISYGTIGDKNGADPPYYEDLCIEITPSGKSISVGLYIIFILISFGLAITGFYIQDNWIIVLGGFASILVGLFTLFYGIAGFKDTTYTWGLGIITLMLGAYFAIRGAYESLQ